MSELFCLFLSPIWFHMRHMSINYMVVKFVSCVIPGKALLVFLLPLKQGNSVARDLPRTGSETNTTIFVIYIYWI